MLYIDLLSKIIMNRDHGDSGVGHEHNMVFKVGLIPVGILRPISSNCISIFGQME